MPDLLAQLKVELTSDGKKTLLEVGSVKSNASIAAQKLVAQGTYAHSLDEETERKLAREETLRQQSASFAQAAANAGPYTSVHMDGAGNAEMDPALAALIGAL